MTQWATAVRLAMADLLAERLLALCTTLALAAVLAPLVILAGLRAGVVQGLREVLLEDPRVREVATAANRSFDAGLLARLAARPDVAFLAPRTRTLSASLLVERPDAPGAGTRVELLPTAPGDPLLVASMDGRKRVVQVARKGRDWLLTTRGAAHRVSVMAPHIADLTRHMIEKVPPDLSRFLLAPMPGLLVRLDVGVGDRVEAGQPLAVVEAMKMENILRAGKSGRVKAVEARAGESLAVDQVILELD